ncbi:hypothetical protein M9458_053130, partial [Cirrhinus mrigala]
NIPQIASAGDESDSVYANTAMLSQYGAATRNRKEPLHYASIDFTKMPPPESDEIRGVSSLTNDYAAIRCYPGGVSEEESSTGSDQPNSRISAVVKENQTILEQEAKIEEVFSQPSEDTTYESITI